MKHPEWDMHHYGVSINLYPVYAQLRPMWYWLRHVREAGLENAQLQIDTIENDRISLSGTQQDGNSFSVVLDRSKDFLPVALECWRVPDYMSSADLTSRFVVEFDEPTQSAAGYWYVGKSISTQWIVTSEPFKTVESILTEIEEDIDFEASTFNTNTADVSEVIDYRTFLGWWSLCGPSFEVDGYLDWSSWTEAVVDFLSALRSAVHSFYYAFPDFHGLQVGILIVVTAAITWYLRRRRIRKDSRCLEVSEQNSPAPTA